MRIGGAKKITVTPPNTQIKFLSEKCFFQEKTLGEK